MQKCLPSVLARQHAVIRQQADRIEEASNPRYRVHLFRQYARAVGGHIRVIDQVVVPALRLHGWKDVPSELLIGHARMKQQVAEALVAAQQGSDIDGTLHSVLAGVARQCTREAAELLPLLKNLLADDEIRSLGSQASAQFSLVFESADAGGSASVTDLIDEARVVLSTLPARAQEA